MRRHDRRAWWLATGLAVIAGYVDAIGFLHIGGLFVSFMSGNSTRLGVAAAAGQGTALVAAALIASFVAGVMLGAFVAMAAGAWRKPAVIVAVAALLAGAALTEPRDAAVYLMAAAMGSANAVFQQRGEVSIGVTYMTGTLVKFGQHLAAAIVRRGPAFAWAPYLLLWCGLIAGAFAGAISYPLLAAAALWIAVAATLLLAAAAMRMGPVS